LAEVGIKRIGPLQKAANWLESFLEIQHVWIALVAAYGLALLQVPWLGDLADGLGLDNNPQLQVGVAAVVLGSIMVELRRLNRRVTPATSGRKQYRDIEEMGNALTDKAKSLTVPEQREIRVLGLTLLSAWIRLLPFLENPEVDGWTVKFAVMAHDETFQQPWIPDDWSEETAVTVKMIRAFREKQGKDHDHMIELFEYEFVPAVHGFRLGNGDVFVSTLHWMPEGRLGDHPFSYDYVPARDFSPGAEAARALFENWFDRAVRSAAEASKREVAGLGGRLPADRARSDGATTEETGR
jgi:hypothetical protein